MHDLHVSYCHKSPALDIDFDDYPLRYETDLLVSGHYAHSYDLLLQLHDSQDSQDSRASHDLAYCSTGPALGTGVDSDAPGAPGAPGVPFGAAVDAPDAAAAAAVFASDKIVVAAAAAAVVVAVAATVPAVPAVAAPVVPLQ